MSDTSHRDDGHPGRQANRVGLVAVSAGVSDPSSSRLLADRITQKSLDLLRESEMRASAAVVELAPLAVDIARATISGVPSEQLQTAIERVAAADAIVASTPIYKAGISGLFKSFLDVVDNDLLVAKPVVLAATAGTSRHALVIDEQMRPLFAYMRALVLPTSVFAASDDWAAVELGERIERASTELAVILETGVGPRIADRAWSSYQHQFAGNASRAARTVGDIDFDSPLMRLAAGGARHKHEPVADSPGGLDAGSAG
jgi:FMN reductase